MSIRHSIGTYTSQREYLAHLLDRLESIADQLQGNMALNPKAAVRIPGALTEADAAPTLVNDLMRVNEMSQMQLDRLDVLVGRFDVALLQAPGEGVAAGRGEPASSRY